MKKLFLFLFIFFVFIESSYSFEIVYPKTKTKTLSSPTTFFIGSSKKQLFINGENIPLHKTGAFAHYVKLNTGINTFTIKSDDKEETYTITRKQPVKTPPAQLTEYKTTKYLIVDNDRTSLRATPVNAGINRISHLQKGILLTSDGEKGNFYRIKLNNKYGWIEKNSVKNIDYFEPAKLTNYEYNETDSEFILTFHLNKKVPFEITEGNVLELKFYNTDREHYFKFPYTDKTGSTKLYGYNGEYNNNDFIFKIRKPQKIDKNHPLKGITITVDAGHGGKENGAIGCLGDKEKDITLKMAKYLENELRHKGANVIMTRQTDTTTDLYSRVKLANDNNSTFFVSIHNNALPDTLNPYEHRGTSVYYYYDEAKDLAQTVLDTMTKTLKTNNDNIHQASFAVVRNTNALSILIEVAYLINPDDNELLINEHFQKQTAKSIADGLENFLKN